MTTKNAPAETFDALLAWEAYERYAMLNALNGDYNQAVDREATAAWAIRDVDTLIKCAKAIKVKGDFTPPDKVMDALPKPKVKVNGTNKKVEREWTISERIKHLREAKRTQARAYVELARMRKDDTPFS